MIGIRTLNTAFLALVLAAAAAAADAAEPSAPAAQQAAAPDDAGDLARKAEIMNSSRWRRAIFELGEWLSAQPIYTPDQVLRIKTDFNRRVAAMTSYELEYLLDDLDAKFKLMDSPEAKDARAWVGQYLSVLSDRKRAEALKDVPDVVKMSAGQLQQEIAHIEEKRSAMKQRQADFDASRQQLVQLADESRQLTAKASAAATAQMNSAASFSPYRGGGTGDTPFANARTGAEMEFMGFGFGFW
jgi:hypothetical protein